jgi:hypothetical protein
MTGYSSVNIFRRFGNTYSLHLQSKIWKTQFSSKRYKIYIYIYIYNFVGPCPLCSLSLAAWVLEFCNSMIWGSLISYIHFNNSPISAGYLCTLHGDTWKIG